jgi:hypothetical protein
MKLIYIFLLLKCSYSYNRIINNYLLGNYILRKTNDPVIKNSYSYLILNQNNTIKLKTVSLNNIIATKVSRTGIISIKNNYKNIFNNEDVYNIILEFNNVNKYSYSLFGIEYPEIKYKQNSNYSKHKYLQVKRKDSTFVVTDDNNYYYIFDLIYYKYRLPYIEISVNTLLASNILGFIINALLLHLFSK